MFRKIFTKTCTFILANRVLPYLSKAGTQQFNRIGHQTKCIHLSPASFLHEQQARMGIVCTCSVCQNRFSKTFSKHSYEKGVVIIRCPQCSSNHLIADHLDWFKDFNCKNIEEMLAAKGEKVRKYLKESDVDHTGVIEIDEESKKEFTKIDSSDKNCDQINEKTLLQLPTK